MAALAISAFGYYYPYRHVIYSDEGNPIKWWDYGDPRPMAPYALMSYVLSQANQGLWEMAQLLCNSHDLPVETYGIPNGYKRQYDKHGVVVGENGPGTRPDFLVKISFPTFRKKDLRKKLNFCLQGIVNFLLSEFNPFAQDPGNERWLAEQLTGIKPPAWTDHPLRHSLNSYFAPSLDENSVPAVQLACTELAVKWRDFAWKMDSNFMAVLFKSELRLVGIPQKQWLMAGQPENHKKKCETYWRMYNDYHSEYNRNVQLKQNLERNERLLAWINRQRPQQLWTIREEELERKHLEKERAKTAEQQ